MSVEIAEQTDEEIELIGGGGGIFEIRRDGELLWKKQRSGHFPEPGEVAKLFA